MAYSDDVPQNLLNEQALILVGLPNELDILSEINEALPAPFDFENNTASQRLLQVSYRIPPNVSLGYLELIPSPFNPKAPLLIVAGNNDVGISYAGLMLTTEHDAELAGIFAIARETEIVTSSRNSQFVLSFEQASILEKIVPEVEIAPLSPTPIQGLSLEKATQENPFWLIPVMISSLIFIVFIMGYALIDTQRKRLPVKKKRNLMSFLRKKKPKDSN